MKDKCKVLGIIAFALMMAFFAGCGDKNTGDPTGSTSKTDPTVNWPTGLEASVGQTLADIELPGNGTGTAGAFTWTTPGASVGEVGTNSHSMRFTPEDTATYNIKTQNVNITVRATGKTDPVVNWPAGLQASFGDTLSDITLPDNETGTAGEFTWTTPDSSVGLAGTRSHSMRFTPDDTASYNTKTQNVKITVKGYETIPGAEMALIEAGTFTMGPDIFDDNATVAVTFTNDFYMGKYLVTQELYEAVMEENQSYFTTTNGRPPETGEADAKRPVERVNWYHAIAFCNRLSILEGLTPVYSIDAISNTDADAWLHSEVPSSHNATWNAVTADWLVNGYRLATEAQWEFAARGGNDSLEYTYSGSNNASDVAWYDNNSGAKTHEVGKKAPNELGLYDMSGNVWEWCWDWYADYPGSEQTNYVGPDIGQYGVYRVVRGGSWINTAEGARSVYRFFYIPDDWFHYVGFRLVRP